MPLGGKYQLSPAAGMAAKLPVLHGDTKTATLMSYGYDPELAKISPFSGAMYAVLDSVTKIVAMGGDYSKVNLVNLDVGDIVDTLGNIADATHAGYDKGFVF